MEAARSFYEGVFGWRSELTDGEGPDFWGIYLGEGLNGGMMELPARRWAAELARLLHRYRLDASAQRIDGDGGKVQLAPLEIPAGRILVARDPQGASFALFEGDVDP